MRLERAFLARLEAEDWFTVADPGTPCRVHVIARKGSNFENVRGFTAMEPMLSPTPEDSSQRQAFEKLMPQLYVLRIKGCSMQQLTGLLTECGFTLLLPTVRDYFRESVEARTQI